MRLVGFKHIIKRNKESLCFFTNTENYAFFGSFILYKNDSNLICTSEDIYRDTQNGHLLKKGKNKALYFNDALQQCIDFEFEIYLLNSEDYILIFSNGIKIICYRDSPHCKIAAYNFNSITFNPFLSQNPMSEIVGRRIEYVENYLYDDYENITFKIKDCGYLGIYCFSKIIQNDMPVFYSYEQRNCHKNFKELFCTLKGETIKNIVSFDKMLYVIYLTNNIQIVILIDNRYEDFPELKISFDNLIKQFIIRNNELKWH